jgi:type II secretory pathway predicted ATPase ExeA/pSer/pThr/pTyr-binding forkhead associated (FHA) protein
MYLELFKLNDLPFRLSPDPQFLFLSKNHARAKAYMESTIWFTDGFVIITGDIGAGKTTLIETFLRELDKDVIVAQVNQTQVSVTEFLQSVLVQFGFQPFRMKKAELMATLNQYLIEQYTAGKKVMLIVDEAQNLSNRVLEEVRMLSGIETTRDKVLRIILAGQPELNDKLDSPELIQLVQRVRLRFHLTPLSAPDTRAYIEHRLQVAGSGGRQIFQDETFPVIFQYSGGVPRLVNTLCDTALMSAFAVDSDTVGLEELKSAIEELRWVDYATRLQRLRNLRQQAARAGATRQHAVPQEEDIDPNQTGRLRSMALHLPGQLTDTPLKDPERPALAKLLLILDGRTVAEYPLVPGRLVVGRAAESDIPVDSKFVSRNHCQIITSAHGTMVEDLNSTNGVHIQGIRVRRHELTDGDTIALGRHDLVYVDLRHATTIAGLDPTSTAVFEEGEIDFDEESNEAAVEASEETTSGAPDESSDESAGDAPTPSATGAAPATSGC